MFGRIKVRIKGLTPLLMNRLADKVLETKSTRRTEQYDTPERVEQKAYRDGKGQLYIPAYAIYSMIIHTAGQYRTRRTSLSSMLAGSIHIEPEQISLGLDKYELDKRPVTNPTTKGKVQRVRPKIPDWEATFYIVYDKEALGETAVPSLGEVLRDAGRRVGLLDFRPARKGWFGTFNVEEFEIEE